MRNTPLTPQQRSDFYDRAKDIVLVDFDGTLCRWSYPDMGEPEPGAREFMEWLENEGYRAVVWSSRFSPEFNTEREVSTAMHRVALWMARYQIPYAGLDTGMNGKRLCLAYVDDRGVGYTGDWEDVKRQVCALYNDEYARRQERLVNDGK